MAEPTFSAAELAADPVLYIELARRWAAGGPVPQSEAENWLKSQPAPHLPDPSAARELLWSTLSFPERGRSLAWLDRIGLLEELIPSWGGDEDRRVARLLAVEEVHLEHWALGLSKTAYDWLCVYQDQKVGRLNGWAIAGLAALLLVGDLPTTEFARRIDGDLRRLGALDTERERIVTAIMEYPLLDEIFHKGKVGSRSFSPTSVVAAVSNWMADAQIPMDLLRGAIHCTDTLLLRYAAPGHVPSRIHS